MSSVLSTKICYEGKWISMFEREVDMNGNAVKWEFIERNASRDRNVDCVEIIPLISRGNSTDLALILSYRVPIDNFVLEFPGGIIESGQTPLEAAIRELKEETGISMLPHELQSVSVSNGTCIDPYKSTERTHVFFGKTNEENIGEQELENEEIIKVVFFPYKTNLLKEIIAYATKEQCDLDARVYSWALGLEFTAFHALNQ